MTRRDMNTGPISALDPINPINGNDLRVYRGKLHKIIREVNVATEQLVLRLHTQKHEWLKELRMHHLHSHEDTSYFSSSLEEEFLQHQRNDQMFNEIFNKLMQETQAIMSDTNEEMHQIVDSENNYTTDDKIALHNTVDRTYNTNALMDIMARIKPNDTRNIDDILKEEKVHADHHEAIKAHYMRHEKGSTANEQLRLALQQQLLLHTLIEFTRNAEQCNVSHDCCSSFMRSDAFTNSENTMTSRMTRSFVDAQMQLNQYSASQKPELDDVIQKTSTPTPRPY